MTGGERSGPISIGAIGVSGVDATAARVIAPAIERALTEAARDGLTSESRKAIRLDLPHGATARDVARAVTRALRRR